MPQEWYNIQSDLKKHSDPPLHPGTKLPFGTDDLAPKFPMELIKQEKSMLPKKQINYAYPEEKITEAMSKLLQIN